MSSVDNTHQPSIKEHLADKTIWQRGLYMLFFGLAYVVAETLMVLIAIFQFFAALITGTINGALHQFGANIASYILQIARFNTFNSEATPYPFGPWPGEVPGESPWTAPAQTEAAEIDPAVQPAQAPAETAGGEQDSRDNI